MSIAIAANRKSKERISCANCGQEENDEAKLKACVVCMLVKYCNKECQIAHRPLHKKECEIRAAELHEEALFRQPPRREDCPICFLMLPESEDGIGQSYFSCCGKVVCGGCFHA
jgi:hypothetical protein